jgi:hypothetical protein
MIVSIFGVLVLLGMLAFAVWLIRSGQPPRTG